MLSRCTEHMFVIFILAFRTYCNGIQFKIERHMACVVFVCICCCFTLKVWHLFPFLYCLAATQRHLRLCCNQLPGDVPSVYDCGLESIDFVTFC